MRNYFVLGLLLLLCFSFGPKEVGAQTKKRPEGVYLSYTDLLHNQPAIPSSKIIPKTYAKDPDWLRKTIKRGYGIKYYMEDSTKKKVSNRKIWGYCSDGVVYFNDAKPLYGPIKPKGNLSRTLDVVGRVCVYSTLIVNMNVREGRYGNPLGPRSGIYYVLMDLESGMKFPLNEKNFMRIISRDDGLLAEYERIMANGGAEKEPNAAIRSIQEVERMKEFLTKYNKYNPYQVKSEGEGEEVEE